MNLCNVKIPFCAPNPILQQNNKEHAIASDWTTQFNTSCFLQDHIKCYVLFTEKEHQSAVCTTWEKGQGWTDSEDNRECR